MRQTTSTRARVQHRCARDAQDCADAQLELVDTLDGRLRAFYAEHDEGNPCKLSTVELARRFTSTADVRQIRRANKRIRQTYGARFRERLQSYGPTPLPFARWIDKPGGDGRSDLSLSDQVDLRIDQVDLEAHADRARTHAHAPRASRPPERERRPATRLHVPRTPLLEHPVGIEAGVLADVDLTHGAKWLSRLVNELRKEKCHRHPVECELALRTLAQRETDNPLRMFRFFLNRAIDGDSLIDTADLDKLTDAAELGARERYAWDPDNPATHWPDLLPEGTAAPPPEPVLEDPARVAARKRLEHEVEERRRRREAERIVGLLLGATLRPSPAERFLRLVKPHVRADIRPGDS